MCAMYQDIPKKTVFKVEGKLCAAYKVLEEVSCPNGDTAGIIKDGQTCSEIVADDNAECYDTSFEATCCASCNAVATSNQNCVYGDKASCFTFLCPSYTDLSTCCDTCASFISTSPTTASTSTSSTSVSTSTSSTSSSTSSTSASSSSTSNSASSTLTATISTASSTSSTSGNTDGSSTNGGVIAGAVIGSIVGVSFLTCGAYIAIKILKKKDNQVADDSSSGIPEKVDRNSGYTPEKLDICTILQEKLDTNSDLPGKALPVATADSIKTHENGYLNTDGISQSNKCNKIETRRNNTDDTDNVDHDDETSSDLSKPNPEFHGIKSQMNETDRQDAVDRVTNWSDVDARRQSLPPIRETAVDAPPIHAPLPPISAPKNTPNIDSYNTETETKVTDNTENEDNELKTDPDNFISNSKNNNADASARSSFIFPNY
ncbi:serine-rich adhesin for platelets-like [Mercenaria mercenaria]|uniref:serine-rich adhesin for platelets-like n=1 Tax=Mercenaria mercenaria TaxID=6596 RepID=UPI00234E8067|nr:serine-rich adhesin for platelets-like [Mercenaria mercenaria]